jgi:hypothetical protein
MLHPGRLAEIKQKQLAIEASKDAAVKVTIDIAGSSTIVDAKNRNSKQIGVIKQEKSDSALADKQLNKSSTTGGGSNKDDGNVRDGKKDKKGGKKKDKKKDKMEKERGRSKVNKVGVFNNRKA